MLRNQDALDWERIGTEARLATDDVSAQGIGQRRLQVIVCPSFNESRAWEVRQFQSEWKLYRPRVVAPWPTVKLRGYDLVQIDSLVLSSFFSRIVKLSVPISPDLRGGGGCDGTVTQLAIFGDLLSECRFQWWSQPPPKWKTLVEVASEMIAAFSAAEESQRQP